MAIVHPLKLMAIGASLVTSTSIWLFDSKPTQPLALESKEITSPTQEPIISSPLPTPKYINQYEASPNKVRTRTVIKNPKLKIEDLYDKIGAYIKLEDRPGDTYYLSVMQEELVTLDLKHISTTAEEYRNYSLDQIKIKLFKNPPGYSDNKVEEYHEPLDKSKLEELFQDLDEVKTKQLLLSLHWKRKGLNSSGEYFYSHILYPKALTDLADLEMRHFSDFDSLKDYVQNKVKSCTDDTKACIALPEELDILEMDQISFFKASQ